METKEFITKSCKRKRRYADVKLAREAVEIHRILYQAKMYYYICKFCRGYHLTRQEQVVK